MRNFFSHISFPAFAVIALVFMSFLICTARVEAQTPYDDTPDFVTPVPEQSGAYLVSTLYAGGNPAPVPLTGFFLEVLPAGATLFDYTVPEGSVFIFGFMKGPTDYIIFQSPVPAPAVPFYERNFPVVFVTTEAGPPARNRFLGTGTVTFDPDGVGSGKQIRITANFDRAESFLGVVTSSLDLRARRMQDNVIIQACDRSGILEFSPPPPENACN